MTEGTNLHYIFYKFFDLIDFNILWSLDFAPGHDTPYNAVYNYFYSILVSFVGEENVVSNIRSNIQSFCRFEENHWFDLRAHNANRAEVERNFKPGLREREKFDFNEEYQLFGTIDRISYEDKKVIIIDYKTGRVPKGILGEEKTGIYCSKLDNTKAREGNFYVILYLLRNGYKIGKEDDGWHFYNRGFKADEVIKTIDFMFLYTGHMAIGVGFPPYYACRKKPTMRSINFILDKVIEMRLNTDWSRDVNYYRCRDCPFYLTFCKEYCTNIAGMIEFDKVRGVIRSGEESEDEAAYESDGGSAGVKKVEQNN